MFQELWKRLGPELCQVSGMSENERLGVEKGLEFLLCQTNPRTQRICMRGERVGLERIRFCSGLANRLYEGLREALSKEDFSVFERAVREVVEAPADRVFPPAQIPPRAALAPSMPVKPLSDEVFLE